MSKPVWVLPSLFIFIAAMAAVASAQQNDGPPKPPARIQQAASLLSVATINQDSNPDVFVIGRVEAIDHKTGWVRVIGEERELRLRYPYHKIKDIKKGDTVSVRLASSSGQTIEKVYVRTKPFNLETWLAMYNLEEINSGR